MLRGETEGNVLGRTPFGPPAHTQFPQPGALSATPDEPPLIPGAPTVKFPGQPGQATIAGALPEYGGATRARRTQPENWQAMAPTGGQWLPTTGYGNAGEWFEDQWKSAQAFHERRQAEIAAHRGQKGVGKLPATIPTPGPPPPTPPPTVAAPAMNAPLPGPTRGPESLARDVSAMGAATPEPLGVPTLPPYNPNDERYRPQVRYSGPGAPSRKGAELRARQEGAQYETGIRDTGTGFEVSPPKTRAETNSWRNRLKQAGLGALHGIAMQRPGATMGELIGGAGGGAATGGISPRLVEAYSRQQQIDRLQGEVGQEQQLELGAAKIRDVQLNPELEMLRIQRQIANDESLQDYRTSRSGQAASDSQQRAEQFKRQQADRERRTRAIENRPTTGEGIAHEGESTVESAGRAVADIQKELDSLKGDYESGKNSIARKDALWRARASKIIREAPILSKPTMAEALAQAQSEDADFTSGTYNETVANTEGKQKRIEKLESELLDVNKEKRGGQAKAARRKAKKPSSDGKYHYSLDEVKAAGGSNWQSVLEQLRKRDNVIID